jgi:hypothetical protein
MAKKFQYLYRNFPLENYDERHEFDDFENLLNQYGSSGFEVANIDVETTKDKSGREQRVIHVIMKREV